METEDKLILEECVRIRRDMITATTKNGIPKEEEDRALLLQALNGLEKVALSRAKLKNEEQTNSNISLANELIVKMLTGSFVQPEVIGECRVLEEVTGEIDVVPGETEIGVISFDYTELIKD